LSVADACAGCGQAGALRPDVVWFGEMPYGLDTIDAELAASDLFVAMGTSGSVYPAAGLVEIARAAGIRTCEINLAPSDNATLFDEAHYGLATETVPRVVDALLAPS
jgi:NAD-dependent deacetylase